MSVRANHPTLQHPRVSSQHVNMMTFKNTIKAFLLVLALTIISSCETNKDDSLVLVNNSSFSISVSETVPWTDTLVSSLDFNLENEIYPNHLKTFDRGIREKTAIWRTHIKLSKDKKLRLWIFNSDTLKKYAGQLTINQIADKKLFDTVLVFSEDQLEDMDYHIVYRGVR